MIAEFVVAVEHEAARGLDVKRLTQAVIAASDEGHWSVYRTEGGVSWMDRREVAGAIAEAYRKDADA